MSTTGLPPGRHAVLTGVSSGIGWAIAQALLAQGWQVTGLSRTPPPAPHEALRWLPADLDDSTGRSAGDGKLYRVAEAEDGQQVGRKGNRIAGTGLHRQARVVVPCDQALRRRAFEQGRRPRL